MAGSFFPGFMNSDHLHKVCNPPGGKTNDIFDLEKRQRQRKLIVYEEEEAKRDKTFDKEDPRKSLETEDILNPVENANRKLRRSLSDCNIKPPAGRTPPLAVGKENLGTHFKGSLSPRITTTMSESEVKVIDESEGEDDELLRSEKPKRNPITGEGMEDGPPIKLEDTTNTDKQEDAAAKQDSEVLEQKKPRRPCIRVRQPPGGKSSIIF